MAFVAVGGAVFCLVLLLLRVPFVAVGVDAGAAVVNGIAVVCWLSFVVCCLLLLVGVSAVCLCAVACLLTRSLAGLLACLLACLFACFGRCWLCCCGCRCVQCCCI